MAFSVDPVIMMADGYGFVVRDEQSKKLIISICYETEKDAKEAGTAMEAVLAKAASATVNGAMFRR